MSGLRHDGPRQGPTRRSLRRPARLWHPDVAGVEEAPDALREPNLCQAVLGPLRPPHAAKNCLLTTRAAKWATVQVGTGRTVSEVAGELDCDWHTVNDAVTTYGKALLEADRKRLNKTTAIGLDETSFVKHGAHSHSNYATMADVENHQIIDILPSRSYIDVAGWLDKQPQAWKQRVRFGALDMSTTYAAVYSVVLPARTRWSTRSMPSPSPIAVSMLIRRRVQTEQTRAPGPA